MFCGTGILLPLLLVVSASAKSSKSYRSASVDNNAEQTNSLTPDQRTAETHHSNVGAGVRFFFSPAESTLPPVVTSATWKHSSSANDDGKKDGTADGKVGGSHWSNEIVRQGSFSGKDQNEKTKKAPRKTSAEQFTSSEPGGKRKIAENKEIFEARRRSKDSDRPTMVEEEAKEPAKRDRDAVDRNRTQHHSVYDDVSAATSAETSIVDAIEENGDEIEPSYDDDDANYDDADYADYEADDEEYEDDYDDAEFYDDDSNIADGKEDEETDKRNEDQRVSDNKKSIGREGVQYHEYEISAESSRGIDYDTTNAEVVNELQVVDRSVRRRRRKGRPTTGKRTRSKTRRRRRKRPPVEPVGRVKRPVRTRRPARAGTRRRKTKVRRRRRKGHTSGQRRTRKNRRNKQTTSLSLDFGDANGDENKLEQSYGRPQVGESTKPRLQHSSILQRLQQQYQQEQQRQQDVYSGQYYVPRYVDIHAGQDRRQIVAASTDVRGPSSQHAATNRAVHASVLGRVPPVDYQHTAQQTSQRPQATPLQGHYFDQRQYYQLPQHQRQQYYHNHPRYQQQQQQQPPRHQNSRRFYQSYYQQQSPPTYSRHQQQIHFIVPTSDFDLRRIPQLMSALGLQNDISSPESNAGADAQIQVLGYQPPSPNSGAYRESQPTGLPAEKNVDDQLLLSGSGIASADDPDEQSHYHRQQRSTSSRRRVLRATEEDDAEAADHRHRQQTRRERPGDVGESEDVDDDVDDDEEYVDNSDIEITTRSPNYQTTAFTPL